jgi:type IV secretory pathway TraG/TraD family ATPase VirD4
MWFVIDELAALGRLNAFTTLLSESRKYGGCVLAATQSINQLFENYGHYSGSAIFDQFATKFIFRSSEPSTARIISDVFGHIEYASQQKNTSYGAHEHRDGVSYTEQEKRKQLITTHDIASLGSLECFVGLPEPNIRIARVKLPAVTNVPQQHQGFMPYAASYSLPYSPQYSTYSIWDSIPSQQELENMKKQQTKAIGEQSQQGQGQEGLRPQVRVNKEESMEEDVTKEQQIS